MDFFAPFHPSLYLKLCFLPSDLPVILKNLEEKDPRTKSLYKASVNCL